MCTYLSIAQVGQRCYSGSARVILYRTDQRNSLDNQCSGYRRYVDPLSQSRGPEELGCRVLAIRW